VRVAEVHLDVGVDAELSVLGHLGALIPRQRPAQLFGQRRDRSRDCVTDSLGAVPGQRRPVLGPRLCAVAFHARQMEQHRESGRPLDERPDR